MRLPRKMTKGVRVFRKSKSTEMTKYASAAADVARRLGSDENLREQLLRASEHASRAKRRVRRRFGRLAPFREIALDQQLRSELVQMVEELRGAWESVDSKRTHRRRNSLLLLTSVGAVSAIVASRSSRLRSA